MNISGYTIKSRIGAGGQAMVYHAIQESLQRPVALKVLNPMHSDSPEFTARFLNEGRMLANLGHSNVITIHDIGVEGGFHYISMELVEGGDLKRHMKESIEPVTALRYIRTIADCLATAHDKNIVHRDIKPGNVLFRADGTLLLTDFGIAKKLDGESDLTMTGTTVGSPHYLSPEQAQGKVLDGRADIYSLGIMTFELLAGAKPFVGDSDIDTIFKHINDPIPRLPEHVSEFQELIDRMIAKLPADRFENARAVVAYIDRMNLSLGAAAAVDLDLGESADVAGTQTNIPNVVDDPDNAETVLILDEAGNEDAATEVNLKTAPPTPARRRWLAPVMAACVVAGVALAWLLFGGSQTPETTTPAAQSGAGETATLPAATGQPAQTETAAPPSLVTSTDSATRVASLLASADRAIEDFRLTKPEGDNALEYFNEVLALDPANPVAADGYRRIAERYAVLARSEIKRENYTKAGDFVDRGLSLDGQNTELLALRQQVDTAITDGRAGRGTSGEIKGESPKELYERVKSWFK